MPARKGARCERHAGRNCGHLCWAGERRHGEAPFQVPELVRNPLGFNPPPPHYRTAFLLSCVPFSPFFMQGDFHVFTFSLSFQQVSLFPPPAFSASPGLLSVHPVQTSVCGLLCTITGKTRITCYAIKLIENLQKEDL